MKANLIQGMYIIMNRSEFSSNQGREKNNEKNLSYLWPDMKEMWSFLWGLQSNYEEE